MSGAGVPLRARSSGRKAGTCLLSCRHSEGLYLGRWLWERPLMPCGGGSLGSQAQVLRKQPAHLPRRRRGELHVRGGRQEGRVPSWLASWAALSSVSPHGNLAA